MRVIYFVAFILVLLWKDISLISADICIPSHHILVSNYDTYAVFNRKDFRPSVPSEHFIPLVLDEENNRLIIGAKNVIFFINDTSLQQIKILSWNSDEEKTRKCHVSADRSLTIPADSCANYIQYLAIYKNKLLMCGTNSLSPKYKLISLETFDVITEKVDFDVCSSPNPNITMVAKLTEYGELISGTYKDFSKRIPVISGAYITKNPPRVQLITESSRNDFLNNPEFVSSIYVGNSVYIFFIEEALENKDTLSATVARLCTTDNGGSQMINENMWTTLRKSRLICEINDGMEIFNFQNLVDVAYDENQDVFYALYTMFKSHNMHSAVCTFKRQDVDHTFSSHFLKINGLDKDSIRVQSVDNGNFLKGCEVNPANNTRSDNKLPPGKQPTNSLNTESLLKAKSYSLMSKKVYCNPAIFEFIKTGATFTQLVLDPIRRKVNGLNTSPLLNIATESGSIIMVYKNKNSKPYIVEEISTDIGRLKRILINKEKGMLYISSDVKLVGLKIDNCDRYATKQQCLDAHNPRCGWSTKSKRCVSSWNVSDDLAFEQDLRAVPRRSNYFRKWSGWEACEYSESKYCLCRHRSCSSCDKSLCKSGEYVQVKNCSVNSVSNLTKWMVEGSQDGHWSEWLEWSDCHKGKCGNDTKSRIRTCTAPPPSNGGKKCLGDSFQCKSCPFKSVVMNKFWSGWSTWSECVKGNVGYTMQRYRNCSEPASCPGNAVEIQHCFPGGVKWGSWSICTCMQRVRHRYPEFINGCDNCTQLNYPQYQICDPDPVHCPTEKAKMKDKVTTKTPLITTKRMELDKPSSAKVSPTLKLTSENEETNFATSEVTTHTKSRHENTGGVKIITPFFSKADPNCDGHFTLIQVVIISCCILVISFLISLLIICILLRRKKREFKVYHNGKSANSDNYCTELINKEEKVT